MAKLFPVSVCREMGWQGSEAEAFSLFMELVNQRVERKTGLSILDFPDWHWADAFTSEVSSQDAAEMFISDMIEEGEFEY
jgi:hypothetical protein